MTRTMAMAAAVTAGLLTGEASAQPQAIHVFPNGSRPSARNPDTYFTGAVRLDPQFSGPDTPLSAGHVTFEPGARSAWHTHPAGQLLIISSGRGWVQESDGPKRQVDAGDVIWIPAGVRHWHGASATNGMTHYAIQNSVDGKNVDWLEKVSDEQYAK